MTKSTIRKGLIVGGVSIIIFVTPLLVQAVSYYVISFSLNLGTYTMATITTKVSETTELEFNESNSSREENSGQVNAVEGEVKTSTSELEFSEEILETNQSDENSLATEDSPMETSNSQESDLNDSPF